MGRSLGRLGGVTSTVAARAHTELLRRARCAELQLRSITPCYRLHRMVRLRANPTHHAQKGEVTTDTIDHGDVVEVRNSILMHKRPELDRVVPEAVPEREGVILRRHPGCV